MKGKTGIIILIQEQTRNKVNHGKRQTLSVKTVKSGGIRSMKQSESKEKKIVAIPISSVIKRI